MNEKCLEVLKEKLESAILDFNFKEASIIIEIIFKIKSIQTLDKSMKALKKMQDEDK